MSYYDAPATDQQKGLTNLEVAALQIGAAMVSGCACNPEPVMQPEEVAKLAVLYAKAIMDEAQSEYK